MEDRKYELALKEGRRLAIAKLQSHILDTGINVGPEVAPVQNLFAPGMYSRTITLPVGIVIVGKIHRHAHVNVISKGRIAVFTESGGVEVFEAPYTFVSEPRTKRVVEAIEETVWTTVHRTDKTDLAAIEAELICAEVDE